MSSHRRHRHVAVATSCIAAALSLGLPARVVAAEQVCAVPVVFRAELRDIHESWFNGPEGYAFFAEAGEPKTGELPAHIGENPTVTVDTDVYASNFQGPVLVRHEKLRPQWEWTADGQSEISDRVYPVIIARRCASDATALPTVLLHVDEHDEVPFGNDAVGALAFRLYDCKEALTGDAEAAWTEDLVANGHAYDGQSGADDVVRVSYRLWCYRCPSGPDCERGVNWNR